MGMMMINQWNGVPYSTTSTNMWMCIRARWFPMIIIGWWLVLPDRSWMLRWVAIASAYPLVISLMACWKTSPFKPSIDGVFTSVFPGFSEQTQPPARFKPASWVASEAFVWHSLGTQWNFHRKWEGPGIARPGDCCKLMVFFLYIENPKWIRKIWENLEISSE